MPRRRTAAMLVTAGVVLGAAVTLTGAADATPSLRAVPNSVPGWTAHASRIGPARASATVRARVYLSPRGGTAGLQHFVAVVSDPSSARYRKFLTARQYQHRFGVRQATVVNVAHYLRANGLRVGAASSGNHYLPITGTVSTAEHAFATHLVVYRHNGLVVRAPSTPVRLPATLAPFVLTVTGLDTSPHKVVPATAADNPPPGGFRNAAPCSKWFGEYSAARAADGRTKLPRFRDKLLSYAPCGYTGAQFRSAYEGNSSYDGSGVTVAITDAYAAPTIALDANRYAKLHGDGAYVPGQLTQTTPKKYNRAKKCGPGGWYGEETLDVEAVHAMAPGAKIAYYASASCFDNDFADTLQKIVDDDKAQLVSNSWGDLESNESHDTRAVYENVFMQGAAEGISFMFSSGDDGDEKASSGKIQADYPTSSPNVTSVGGTSTSINVDGNIGFQTGWGTTKSSLGPKGKHWVANGFLYGAGGGTSTKYARPDYQDGWTASRHRQVPDVAMDADPSTGMLVGETQTFPNGVKYDEYRIGGTSLASPLFAGMTALTLQASGSRTGLGVANYTIYAQGSTGVFTDVAGKPPVIGVVRADYANGVSPAGGIVYSARTFNHDSSLKVTRGYDLVTGLGVPNAGWTTALGSTG